MLSGDSKSVAIKARALYDEKIRPTLENSHQGEFVCVEPESGQYFLGKNFDEAVNQAIDSFPDRLTHTFRVGHVAALHLGVMLS